MADPAATAVPAPHPMAAAPPSPPPQPGAAGDGWERVAMTLSDLEAAPARRAVVRLPSNNRAVVLFRLDDGSVSALDEFCYHHGGPLSDGDIEELPGGRCVVLCPWHQYKIDVRTGDCLYVGLDPATGATGWKSKGVKQRPHEVAVGADGGVWVRDSAGAGAAAAAAAAAAASGDGVSGGGPPPPRAQARVESDTYAFMTVAPQPRDRVLPPRRRPGLAAGLAEQDALFASGGGVAGGGMLPLHSSMRPPPWGGGL